MTRCPKCKSNLRVPERGEPDSLVRCPRCRREFARREVLSVPVATSGESVGAGGELDWHYEIPDEATTNTPADQKTAFKRRRYYSRTRLPKNALPKKKRRHRKPKTKLTRGDFVKIVLGGLFAFPVAQLILWWGFQRDPLRLGPQVATVAPFVVPRMLRGLEPLPIESPKYVANPDTTLLQGQPFDFGKLEVGERRGSIQKGMPRQYSNTPRLKLDPPASSGPDAPKQ